MVQVTRRRLILAACAALLTGGALVLAGFLSDDFRREVRIALGLPKIWAEDFYVNQSTHPRVACPDPVSDPIVIITGGAVGGTDCRLSGSAIGLSSAACHHHRRG